MEETAETVQAVGGVGVTSIVPGGTFFWKMAAPMTPPIVEKTAPTNNMTTKPMTRRMSTKAMPRFACCGCVKLVVVFTAKVRDQLFAFEVPECVLQLHQLNEQVVLRVEARRVHRALEVERQPLLNAAHVGAAGQVEEQRDVEHDGRGENTVAAQ